jgi:hypothetical protein
LATPPIEDLPLPPCFVDEEELSPKMLPAAPSPPAPSATPPISWVYAADAADDDEDGEEVLAPQMPVATKTTAEDAPRMLLADHDTDDVRHVEKGPAEPYDGLLTTIVTLGDEEE